MPIAVEILRVVYKSIANFVNCEQRCLCCVRTLSEYVRLPGPSVALAIFRLCLRVSRDTRAELQCLDWRREHEGTRTKEKREDGWR